MSVYLPIWVIVLTVIGVLLFLILVAIGLYNLTKYLLERRKRLKEQLLLEKTYRINLGQSIFEENPTPFLPEYWKSKSKKKEGRKERSYTYRKNIFSKEETPQRYSQHFSLHKKYENNFNELFGGGKSIIPIPPVDRANNLNSVDADGENNSRDWVKCDRIPISPTMNPLWYDSTTQKNTSEYDEAEGEVSTTWPIDSASSYGYMDYSSRSMSTADVRNLKDQLEEKYDSLNLIDSEFGGMRSRTASAMDLTRPTSQMDASKPFLRFSVILGPDGNVGVTLFEVIDIPRKYLKSSLYIRLNFFPKVKKTQTTRFIKTGVDPIAVFNECFEFCGVDEADLEKSILRFCVMARDSGVGKDKLVGDLVINCSRLQWTKSSSVYCRELNTKRIMKKGTTSSSMMHMDLGRLFIVLQNQPTANRIKVFIKKATDLPNLHILPAVLPEHYVIVNLLKNGSHVSYKETRAQKGQNPVWNEPFLFDISNDVVEDYSIEFIIMRGRLFHKNGVLGHVVVGSKNTNKRGMDHWNNFLHPAHGLETAKWHDILPVVSYVDGTSKKPFL